MSDIENELMEIKWLAEAGSRTVEKLLKMDTVKTGQLLSSLYIYIERQKLLALSVIDRFHNAVPSGLVTDIPIPSTCQAGSCEIFEDEILRISIPLDIPKIKTAYTPETRQWWYSMARNAVLKAKQEYPSLPFYDRAFVIVDIHSPSPVTSANNWDTANRACNLVFNGLKGLLFHDDSVDHMAYAVTGRIDQNRHTDIYLCHFQQAGRMLDRVQKTHF